MLYMPSIFTEDLMDDFMNDFDKTLSCRRNPLYGRHEDRLMKTDIREKEDSYELDVELPGYKKEDIRISLERGNLTVSAEKSLDKEEKDEKTGKIIRRERFSGNVARSFYVGDALHKEDISAKYADGVLRLVVPKKAKREEIPEDKYIAITD